MKEVKHKKQEAFFLETTFHLNSSHSSLLEGKVEKNKVLSFRN